MDDPADLTFRQRPRPHKGSQSSGTVWWAVAIIGAILFVVLIHALVQRTAWTAGRSDSVPRPVPTVTTEADAAPTFTAAPAAMPMVYRCVDAGGGVSFQSQPCGPGQRTTRAIPAPPDMEPIRPRITTRPRVQQSVYYSGGSSTYELRRQSQLARCAMARGERDRTLAAVGLRRTYDLLQRLDAMVQDACKGV